MLITRADERIQTGTDSLWRALYFCTRLTMPRRVGVSPYIPDIPDSLCPFEDSRDQESKLFHCSLYDQSHKAILAIVLWA